MESQPLAAPLRAGSAQHNPCTARGAPTSGRPNVPAQSNSSPTTPQVKRRCVEHGEKFSSNHDFQSRRRMKSWRAKAIIKMLLDHAEQHTCNDFDLWSRTPRSPSRSALLAPDLTRWSGACVPPLSRQAPRATGKGKAARETNNAHESSRRTQLRARPTRWLSSLGVSPAKPLVNPSAILTNAKVRSSDRAPT